MQSELSVVEGHTVNYRLVSKYLQLAYTCRFEKYIRSHKTS